MAETKEVKFEDSLKGLEKIVEELEKGNLPLDVSLKKYEEGVKLAQQLSKRLEQAQKRFEVGLIAITDVQKAQAAFDQAVASEIVSKRTLANQQELLRTKLLQLRFR